MNRKLTFFVLYTKRDSYNYSIFVVLRIDYVEIQDRIATSYDFSWDNFAFLNIENTLAVIPYIKLLKNLTNIC